MAYFDTSLDQKHFLEGHSEKSSKITPSALPHFPKATFPNVSPWASADTPSNLLNRLSALPFCFTDSYLTDTWGTLYIDLVYYALNALRNMRMIPTDNFIVKFHLMTLLNNGNNEDWQSSIAKFLDVASFTHSPNRNSSPDLMSVLFFPQ